MKLLVLLLFIAIIATCVYFYLSQKMNGNKKYKKRNRKPLIITALVVVVLLGFLVFGMYSSANAPDTQCTTIHMVKSNPPTSLKSAMDYFMQGNYDYDKGNCNKAIIDYTTSIQLNPNFPEAYNNRAYTYMRMRDYKDALLDLNTALRLKPDYIQALMNRGDIHNYYYQIDRQSTIADYKKVISLGGIQSTSVCGHLFLAEHNGWNAGTFLDLPREIISPCN